MVRGLSGELVESDRSLRQLCRRERAYSPQSETVGRWTEQVYLWQSIFLKHDPVLLPQNIIFIQSAVCPDAHFHKLYVIVRPWPRIAVRFAVLVP
jgi:hypothetical protein